MHVYDGPVYEDVSVPSIAASEAWSISTCVSTASGLVNEFRTDGVRRGTSAVNYQQPYGLLVGAGGYRSDPSSVSARGVVGPEFTGAPAGGHRGDADLPEGAHGAGNRKCRSSTGHQVECSDSRSHHLCVCCRYHNGVLLFMFCLPEAHTVCFQELLKRRSISWLLPSVKLRSSTLLRLT